MLNTLLHPLLSLHGWEAYTIVAALCFGEAAFLLGFVLPGETAVVLGGVLASEHHVSIQVMVIVVVVAAILGDTVGYFVGKEFGPFLLSHRPLRDRPGVDKARAFVARRGSAAVFIGRFTAFFRAVVPGVAGMSGLAYRKFVVANAAGGLIWGTAFTLAGYAVGKSYQRVLKDASTASYVIIGVAAALLVSRIVWRRVKEHRELVEYRAAHEHEDVESRP
ncbi:MAG: putative rane protein [Acidimicrobiaceae bacterium]|nr:putative rane protein [Acidimicrobiaceae bacterium]